MRERLPANVACARPFYVFHVYDGAPVQSCLQQQAPHLAACAGVMDHWLLRREFHKLGHAMHEFGVNISANVGAARPGRVGRARSTASGAASPSMSVSLPLRSLRRHA